MWAKIPDDGSVNFYEDDNCSGRIVYSSEKGNYSSSKELAGHGKEGDTVRSLLVMETSRYPTNGMVHMCESAQLTNNSTDEKTNELTSALSWNSSDGNLSINWCAALPNASVTE
ncbi:hypothetical protein JG687_00002194 [Phytophthora cactorum]|uniref:Uncharacterized protein n=1 Tax=Phytophthora cactorum TaxID=29920 RepID=A0A8T1UZ56_9STRA|nr:hypothetical protein JG687_00002194 [Phytophthora cactorum]